MNKTSASVLLFLVFLGAAFGQDFRRSRRAPGGKSLRVGELAPTFVLKSVDGKSQFDLRTHQDEKPVVLFFGSYT